MKKKCGLFLGTFETAKYKQVTTTIEHGDPLLLYTDGVNEAFSVDEEEYGNDRLEVAQDRDSLDGKRGHPAEIQAVGEAGLQEAEHQDDEERAALRKRKNTVFDENVRQNGRRRDGQLHQRPVQGRDILELPVAEDDAGKADGAQKTE